MRTVGMMKGLGWTATLLLFAAAAQARPLPFQPGEKLFYEVRWENVPVARVSLEVLPLKQIRGEQAFHFAFHAQTYPVLAMLYRVDGRIEAFASLDLSRSFGLKKDMQEGRRRKTYRVAFDWDRGVARYIKDDKERRNAPLPEGTLDVLTILYYARSQSLVPGLEMIRPLSSGKKTYWIKAKVVRRETVVVAGRTWPAFVIEPDVHKVGGVFKKSKAPHLFLWISADRERIPLKVVSKVWVGAFIAELISTPPESDRRF